ncbi:arginine deiminase family protein [Pedobacter sp. P351]|uniref:citrulline utilization hydrolase CtlX n=1 Tax=Pedobacter superstes TaxID=3133441 RepID=UPI0030B0B678
MNSNIHFMKNGRFNIRVGSEIGTLRCLIIHSPDSGIGRVAPSQAQNWLFEDIIHLETVRKKEYDFYVKILMYFLDPEKIKGKLEDIDLPENKREFFNPGKLGFHASAKVIEFERLLTDILSLDDIKNKLTASVCALEGCNYAVQQDLINTAPVELAKTLISGSHLDGGMLFPPIPNLIFTRDVGIAINNFILVNKPAKAPRSRETLLARYIFFNHPLFENYRDNILEIPDTLQYFLRPGEEHGERTTIEGGDVMVVSPDHVLIGCTERTSASGASETIKLLFERKVVKKVTVVKIPSKRDFMHIDTIFTQVNRNTWVVLGSLSSQKFNKGSEAIDYISEKRNREKPEILQFERDKINELKSFDCIESLLDDISKNDLGSTEKTQFIYSGNNVFPFDVREQWTDSCNLLALKEGVVLGYDRNDQTIEAFKEKGFNVIAAADLISKLENGETSAEALENTLILMPSAELSRARGGFHCMSMPLFREDLRLYKGEGLTNSPASTILMIRPVNFTFNEQTAQSNAFQDKKSKDLKVHKKALKEFDNLVSVLKENDLNVMVIEDNPEPHTPDSIFPNNWISTHRGGKVFIYPMNATNRRFEKRPEILDELRNRFQIETEIDLSYLEAEGKFLEGTGSMVLDRQNKFAYACISPRTDIKALNIFCDLSGYKPIIFHGYDKKGTAIYHTNVMMCIGESFAVVCLDSISNKEERKHVINSLQSAGKEIIEISFAQMHKFAGNMLELKNTKGESLLVMSHQALQSLNSKQIQQLEHYCKIISSPLPTIENSGGGSVRCMIAEIYLELQPGI